MTRHGNQLKSFSGYSTTTSRGYISFSTIAVCSFDCRLSYLLPCLFYTWALLQVLDYDLSLLPSDFNPADWVEYVVSGRQRWADGTRITDDVTAADDVVHTGADAVEINFRSDEANEQRGFWIEYSGKYSCVMEKKTKTRGKSSKKTTQYDKLDTKIKRAFNI